MGTARQLVSGGLLFQALVEDLPGEPISAFVTTCDDIYAVHRRSVVSAEATERYFNDVQGLIAHHPDAMRYFGGAALSPFWRLSPKELSELTTSKEIIAGFRVSERSVDTRLLADHFVSALRNTPTIEVLASSRVTSVRSVSDADEESWEVVCGAERHGPFDAVVNASWQGQPRLDRSVGLVSDLDFSHRYRVSLFVETERAIAERCLVVSTGPFGDIKSYPGGRCYLSWYEHGLLVEGNACDPPTVPELTGERTRLISELMFERLADMFPFVREITEAARSVKIGGGWVFGEGSLSDPSASLHRRDRLGIARKGTFFSKHRQVLPRPLAGGTGRESPLVSGTSTSPFGRRLSAGRFTCRDANLVRCPSSFPARPSANSIRSGNEHPMRAHTTNIQGRRIRRYLPLGVGDSYGLVTG